MASVTFDIDGYIGAWENSRQNIKLLMKDAGKDPVSVNISSLGGDINHGLSIHDLFVDHQNVTSRLSGFVASAATVIACGCKTVRMNSTALYLIHKVSGWVDAWGYMNEDELQAVIEKLTQDKEENQKIDLIIAQIYSSRTGKPINEIVDLMKKSTWITAEEAKEWGFVDEIINMAGKENFVVDAAKVAMLQANGLPVPPRRDPALQTTDNTIESIIEKAVSKTSETFKNLFNNHKTVTMDKTKYAPLLNTIGVEAMEADKDGGVYLNSAMIEKVNEALNHIAKLEQEKTDAIQAKEAAEAAQSEAEEAKTNAEKAKEEADKAKVTAETERTTLIDGLDNLGTEVKEAKDADAKIAAIAKKLADKPGASNTNNDGGDNTDVKEDWETINNLPHNKEADMML
jgi:ATP-dependent Clp protease, protease subunit